MGPGQGSVSITALNCGDPSILYDRQRHHHTWFLGCLPLPVPLKSLSDWKHRRLCYGSTTLTSSVKNNTTVETYRGEVPQVMKPLPSQGSDKHSILSSSLHSPCGSSFFSHFFCPLRHKAVYEQTELAVMFFILSMILRKPKAECVWYSSKNILLISKTVGKHLSPILAVRREPTMVALPSSNTTWKNQSSVKKIPAAIPAEKKDLSSQYPQLSEPKTQMCERLKWRDKSRGRENRE